MIKYYLDHEYDMPVKIEKGVYHNAIFDSNVRMDYEPPKEHYTEITKENYDNLLKTWLVRKAEHEMKEALTKFAESAKQISDLWYKCENFGDKYAEDYPFKEEFEELSWKIANWADTHTK
jgi:hypothetical protein